MTLDQIDKILDNETACVIRSDIGTCPGDCGACDLVLPTRDILLAYTACRAMVQRAKELEWDVGTPEIVKAFEEMFDKWGISKRTGPSTQTEQLNEST